MGIQNLFRVCEALSPAAFKLKFPAPTQSEKPADATAARAVPSVAAPDYDHMCAGRGSAGLLAPHSHTHARAATTT